jgi:hypothetical protein
MLCAHATMEELLGQVFFVASVPNLYHEDQLSLQLSPEVADRRVGGWLATSVQGCEPGSTGLSTIGRCYQTVH